MTKEQLAEQLTGREYGDEVSPQEAVMAKQSGLVIVHGASDDLMEFRGAIDDELDANNGRTALVDGQGLLPDRDSIDDDAELEKFFIRKRGKPRKIEALWCKEGDYSWTFKTSIPHATFAENMNPSPLHSR